jgi:uncharacterized protein
MIRLARRGANGHITAMADFDPSRHDEYPDTLIRSILTGVKTIAMVGASDNPARPSYLVYKYLRERGFRVIPVNPGKAGQDFLGETFVAKLADIADPVDMIDIFRASDAAPGVVQEALDMSPRPGVIWMQLSVRHDGAAAAAEAEGLTVIMNRCPKIEFGRLSGEISWQGVNSRVISAKKPVMALKGVQKLRLGP